MASEKALTTCSAPPWREVGHHPLVRGVCSGDLLLHSCESLLMGRDQYPELGLLRCPVFRRIVVQHGAAREFGHRHRIPARPLLDPLLVRRGDRNYQARSVAAISNLVLAMHMYND